MASESQNDLSLSVVDFSSLKRFKTSVDYKIDFSPYLNTRAIKSSAIPLSCRHITPCTDIVFYVLFYWCCVSGDTFVL